MTSENNGSRFKRWKKPLTIAFFLALIVLFTLLADKAVELHHGLASTVWWAPLVWTPALTALVVWALRRWAPGAAGSGVPQVLTALAGSPYLPDFSGKILFLEDVEEAPYRIDRMLSTLKLMGALDKIAGFIFGECTACRPSGGYGWLTMDQIFDDHIKPLNIPAYRGAMIGHIKQQFIVPVGGKVELDADAGSFRLLESVFQS